ncbi:MAG: DUF86 domain-containing protein [Methanoregula sp.]|nr:DUF86 domain-containing protein [Methanoregula sp.]
MTTLFQRITEKLPITKEEFIQSDLLKVRVLYHIQVVGEAANGISPEFQKQHKEIFVEIYYRDCDICSSTSTSASIWMKSGVLRNRIFPY